LLTLTGACSVHRMLMARAICVLRLSLSQWQYASFGESRE